MSEDTPSTSTTDKAIDHLTKVDAHKKRVEVSQNVIQRALKAPEQESFVFRNTVRFHTVKGHILSSVCRHQESVKCSVCAFEHELKLPNLPEMIFADNLFEIYIPANAEKPFIQFNAYDALKLVDSKNLPSIMVEASEVWQKARAESLPKIPYPFDWTYTSNYCGTVVENARIEPTSETINLGKLMQRDPILFYGAIPLYEDELADNGCAEMTIKVRVMETNYFILSRFYLRVDRVVVRVQDCRLYAESSWNYMLREYTIREASYANISKEHIHLVTDPAQIWQHLPLISQKTEKVFYPV
ncbi:TIP41-like protein [Aphelenchoides bicaudatus]|nr:TIP41-like protein [Aphelenchoides bicaudatus]